MRGTHQPSRHLGGHLGQDDVDYKPAPPKWFTGAAPRRIWRGRVAEYRRRGQRIEGFELVLADYCMLLAQVEEVYKTGEPMPPSLRTALFKYYALFYDTPADSVASGPRPGREAGNPFERHGRRA